MKDRRWRYDFNPETAGGRIFRGDEVTVLS
jgi:hypothetical protein